MTPANLVRMAKLCGIDLLALTDHNSTANCRAAMEVGKEVGVMVLSGMELCTQEEIHVICLLPDIESATAFGELVRTHIPPIQNRPEIFGNQNICDRKDYVLDAESLLLTNATDIPLSDVVPLVQSYGGICFPAHIDRASYSLISVLGTFPDTMGFQAAECTMEANVPLWTAQQPILKQLHVLQNSDAHTLERLASTTPQALPLDSCSFAGLHTYLESPLP